MLVFKILQYSSVWAPLYYNEFNYDQSFIFIHLQAEVHKFTAICNLK